MPLIRKPIDFKNNQEEAKKWADEEFKTWKDGLHNYNFQAKLKHFIKYDEKFINEYLTVLKGKRIKKLDQMPALLKEKYPNLNKEKLDYYNEQINELEIVLSKNKLQKDLKVYVRVIHAKFLGKILVTNGKVILPCLNF